MSDDEATRTSPDRSPRGCRGWMRRWQRRGRDTAADDNDNIGDGTRCTRALRSAGVAGEQPAVWLRPLVESDPRLGDAFDPRPSACSSPEICRRSPQAGNSRPHADEQVGDHFDRSRSLLHVGDGDRQKRSAGAAVRRWETLWAGGEARRAGEGGVAASWLLGALGRLEAERPALKGVGLVALLVLGALALAPTAPGTTPRSEIKIGRLSQQLGPSRAAIEARISVRESEPGREDRSPARSVSDVLRLPEKGGAVDDLPDRDPYPPLDTDSALARNPQPFGPGSFWYPNGPGRACIYAPGSVLPCYTLVGPGGSPGGPGLDPEAIAASVARRLPLLPGRIQPSPRVTGFTGAVSWFWLEPAPRTEELTVSLAGETVTVVAQPSGVEWRFGDGIDLSGGPGRPYRSGPPPAGAVLHTYETRCLPGDQGRNPYVLGSCGSIGYGVEAVVAWRISFSASVPIEASGKLPTRTTATSLAYPVSEARGFLLPGDSR